MRGGVNSLNGSLGSKGVDAETKEEDSEEYRMVHFMDLMGLTG